jgi:hypothetical protein
MGILIAYLLGILTASKPKNQPTDHNNYSAKPPYTKSPTDRPISIMCIPPPDSDEERANKKKKERRKAIKFWVEVVSAIALLSYLGVTVLIWRTSANELELSQRPWVSITDIAIISPLVFDINGAHTTITYAFSNTGHSPALDGVALFDFMVPYGDIPNPVSKRNDLCKFTGIASGRIHARGIGQSSETWFPGQPEPMSFQISWSINDIKKAMIDIPKSIFPESTNSLPDRFMPTMIVCIAYRPSFTDAQYHTGYILQLVNKKTFQGPLFMEKGEIPAEELQFVFLPFWGVYAD